MFSNDIISFFLWFIFHCIYALCLLHPFQCWWTFLLLPCPGCYRNCFREHCGEYIYLNYGFLQLYAQSWFLDLKATLSLVLKLPFKYCSPKWLYQFGTLPFSFVTSYTKTESAFSPYRCLFKHLPIPFIRRKNISDPVLPGPEYEKEILISLKCLSNWLSKSASWVSEIPIVLRLFLQILYEMILS